MSATLTVLELRPTAFGVEVVGVINTGTEKFQQSLQTDGTQSSAVLAGVRFLDQRTLAQTKSDLAVGQVISLIAPSVTPPPTIDPVVVQFRMDLTNLLREERAVAAGLTTGDDVNTLRGVVQKSLTDHPELKAYL